MNTTSHNIFEDEIALSVATVTLDLIEIFGSLLLPLIVHFEKYGGDPQKRTLVNQLTSYSCAALSIILITKDLTVLTRVVFGCLHPYFGHFASILSGIMEKCMAMFLIEILLYKLFQVLAYRFIIDINEDNVASYFLILNLVVSASVKLFTFDVLL